MLRIQLDKRLLDGASPLLELQRTATRIVEGLLDGILSEDGGAVEAAGRNCATAARTVRCWVGPGGRG